MKTEINARRTLARKLYEAQLLRRIGVGSWHNMAEHVRREYERDVEALFNPHDEEVREALRILRWQYDGST